jgi:hypothetical protein
MLLAFLGSVLLAMSAWGMQRRVEVLGLMRDVQRQLDARPVQEAIVAEVSHEARAEMVREVEQRVPKYGVQEIAIFVSGLAMLIGGLIGMSRAARSADEPASDAA